MELVTFTWTCTKTGCSFRIHFQCGPRRIGGTSDPNLDVQAIPLPTISPYSYVCKLVYVPMCCTYDASITYTYIRSLKLIYIYIAVYVQTGLWNIQHTSVRNLQTYICYIYYICIYIYNIILYIYIHTVHKPTISAITCFKLPGKSPAKVPSYRKRSFPTCINHRTNSPKEPSTLFHHHDLK